MTKIKSHLALPKSITIKPSNIHGLGLFANRDIAKDVELGVSHIEDKSAQDGLIRTALGAFVNHSFTPNTYYVKDGKKLILTTKKEIKAGEEITVDYTPWYDPEVLKTYK